MVIVSSTSGATPKVDWLPRFDFTIDHPVEDVWPLIVHWERWLTNYRVEHVSGERDQVGEVKKVTNDAGSFSVEIVRLVPNERLVYRILPNEEIISHLDPEGFEIFNVYSLSDSKTLVTYETVGHMGSSLKLEQNALDAHFRQLENEISQRWSDNYVPELRRLLSLRGDKSPVSEGSPA